MVREKVGKKRKARTLQSNGVGETTALASGTSDGGGERTKDTSPPPSNAGELSALTLKFVKGLASRLVHDDGDSAEGAFRAAIAVLPKGKLRREIRGNMQVALVVLAGEMDRLRAETKGAATVASTEVETIASNEESEKDESKSRDGQELDASVEQAPVSSVDELRAPPFLACTPRLYDLLRSSSTGVGDRQTDAPAATDTLRALSFNPRSPVDLLSDAMGDELLKAREKAARWKSKRVKVAVARLKLLTRVLAVDPKAALSASGLAFFSHRAEAQASLISAQLRREVSTSSEDGKRISASVAIEGLGLLLRILHVISLASTKPGVDPTRGDADHESEESTFLSSRESTAGGQPDDSASRADRLVLRCIPGTKHGGPGEDPVSVAQSSIARLLGHYAVSVATMCSLDCWQDGARELIRRVGHVSLGRKRGVIGQGGFDETEEDDDPGTDSDAEESSGEEDGGDGVALLRHLLILCVLHLRGDESSTLEFLRCVGDACVFGEEDPRPPMAREVATALAPTCARVLSRLSRPNATTSVVSPIRFLRRAYAFRLVEYLSSSRGKLGPGDGRPLLENLPALSVGSRRPWDFVGDAPIPWSMKQLLGITPPPRGIKGAARTAYSALAAQSGDLQGIAEVLRSSPACTPYALGMLCDALEKVAGNYAAQAEAAGGGKKGDRKKKRKKEKEKMKGKKRRKGGGGGEDNAEETAGLDGSESFFIDTKGGQKPARGAGGISLAPLVDPRTRVDQSLAEDSSEGEEDERDGEEQAGEDQ